MYNDVCPKYGYYNTPARRERHICRPQPTVATHQRATTAHYEGAGCRPPLPLSSATRSRQSVGRGLDPSVGVYGRHGACPPPRGRGRACPARGFSRGWAATEGFRGVGDAAPYVSGCPLTGSRANLRRGVGTPPYGCHSRKRGRGGLYAAREFIRDAVRRLLFFFQHWAGHTVENVSSLPGMDV